MGITLLISSIPNDLEALYMAVDSACSKGCEITRTVRFSGIEIPSVKEYILMKYATSQQPCTTFVNILRSNVMYDFSWFRYDRTAEFKMMVKGCDGRLLLYSSTYRDKIPLSKVKYMYVEGVSPDVSISTPSYFEVAVSTIVVLGVLYAFYTIEGR